MYKLFSVKEANNLIPVVDELLGDMQDAIRDTYQLRDEIATLGAHSVAARNKAQEVAFLLRSAHETKADLDRLGVFLKDVDTGVVDFPSQVGAEVVYLSWEKGQDAITHYHRLNEGSRLPLGGAPEQSLAL
ncbi:DUF2203 domain-containing protein [soil metagenome]